MDRRLLVTGGTGLVAGALRRHLPDAFFASRPDADLTDLAATRRLFDAVRPTDVVHLAALTGGVRFNRDHNADLLTVNTQIDANVLRAAHESGVGRLVGLLSSCAFDMPADRAATETDLFVGQPYAGNLGYGVAKRVLDVACRTFHEQHGSRFSTIAPATIYGPGDHFDSDDGHVVSSLIRRADQARATASDLAVWGTGQAVRQFVYVDDVARLLVRELDIFDGPQTTIVAADEGVTIADLARQIAAAVAFDGDLVFTGDLEGQRLKVLRSERFASRHPDFTFTPLTAGLAETVRAYRESRSRVTASKGTTYGGR